MTAPYLGMLRITGLTWVGRNVVQVAFQSEWPALLVQCYVGRSLVDVTADPSDRTLLAEIPGGVRACPITLLAVDPGEALTDYGRLIGPQPWNYWRLSWQVDPAAVDLHHFDICGAPAPGEAVDLTRVLGRVPFEPGRGAYRFDLPEIAADGAWDYAVVPRDHTYPAGNDGFVSDTTIVATVYPLDVIPDVAGRRFVAGVADGILTVTAEVPV